MSTKHNWVNVTAWALRDWNLALLRYRDAVKLAGWRYGGGNDDVAIAVADLKRARDDYRRRVLSWFWKLLTPIAMDGTQVVPDEVAELLAEEWDHTMGNPSRGQP